MKLRTTILLLFFITASLLKAQDTTHAVQPVADTAKSAKVQPTADTTKLQKKEKHKHKHSADSTKAQTTPTGPTQWTNKPAKDTLKDTAKKLRVIKYYQTTGYAAYNIGYGFPEGDFGSVACVSKGSYRAISVGLPVPKKRLGIAAQVLVGTNPVNTAELINHDYGLMADENLKFSMGNTPDNYTYKAMMTGLYWTFPFSKFKLENKLSIDARVMLGCMFATVPETDVNVNNTIWGVATSGTITNNEASGSSLSFDMGFGIRYLVMPHITVTYNIDYYYANPKFQAVSSSVNDNSGYLSQNSPVVQNSNQHFALLNMGIGLGWAF